MINCLIAQESSFNPVNPRYQNIRIPDREFIWLDNDLAIDSCKAAADSLWMKQSGESFDLLVAMDGPHGSGRYWTITIAVTIPGESIPGSGICLETSTVGWRTLQNFNKLPLPWIGDQNTNGRPEFILWDSFPLHEEASMAEFGLIGWVYEMDPKGELKINWPLTRNLAAEIASAYRIPISDTNDRFQQKRNKIARMLKEFANK